MNKKRIFAVLATGSMMTAGFSVTANAETPVGDHNKDGVVNAKDAAVILQYAAAVGAKNFEGTLPEFVEFLENGQKESTPEIEESAWREAYSKKLAAYLKANPEQDVTDPLRAMWDLKDLNGDGVPELIISTGGYHMAEVAIYTFRGEAINMTGMDDFYGVGQWGIVMFNEKNHLICSSYDYAAEETKPYYTIYDEVDAAALIPVAEFHYEEGSSAANSSWNYNGESVSEAEYNQEIAPYKAMDWVEIGRKYEFTVTIDDLFLVG